jgi:hypothetical protein
LVLNAMEECAGACGIGGGWRLGGPGEIPDQVDRIDDE